MPNVRIINIYAPCYTGSLSLNVCIAVLASSSLDAAIHLWRVESGEQVRTIENGPMDAWTVAFSPDSTQVISGSHGGKVNMFSVETGQSVQHMDTRGKFTLSVACSPDGKYVAAGAIDGIVSVFDLTSGKLVHTLEGHAMPIRQVLYGK